MLRRPLPGAWARRRRVPALAGLLLAVVVALAGASASAAADDALRGLPSAPTRSWANDGNPYVFAIGDSVLAGCVLSARQGGGLGLGWRDLGHVAWPGVTTTLMRQRLQGQGSWPPETVTEDSNALEQVWFHDAGALIVGLGTNDVRHLTLEEYVDNVRWFLEQAHGRPVLWITSHDPVTQDRLDVFNAALRRLAAGAANLKVVEWDALLQQHPEHVRGDGVHPADGAACAAYEALLDAAVPGVVGDDGPRGWWYGATRSSRFVTLHGWAAAWTSPRTDLPRVAVQVDGRPYTTAVVRAASAGGDLYAEAASGRTWGIRLPLSAVGHPVCVQVLDGSGRRRDLGCATV